MSRWIVTKVGWVNVDHIVSARRLPSGAYQLHLVHGHPTETDRPTLWDEDGPNQDPHPPGDEETPTDPH